MISPQYCQYPHHGYEASDIYQKIICFCQVKQIPDKQGRILLPQKLREYAGLEKEAIVNGVQNRVEIWNPEQWDNYLDGSDEDFDEIFAKLAELGI